MITNPIELARLKDMAAKGLVACVVFDLSDYPIVDLEMGNFAKTYLLQWPEDTREIVAVLGGIDAGYLG
jgi:hypothetical protein